jgi:hypothetical protein
MPSIPENPENDELDQLDALIKELKAIKFWDIHYFRSESPEEYEKSAFLARQKRRAEILSKISRTSTEAKANRLPTIADF